MLANFINIYLILFFFISFGLNSFNVTEEYYISVIVLFFLIAVFFFLFKLLLRIINNLIDYEYNLLKIANNLLDTLKLHSNYFFFEFPFWIYLNVIYQETLYADIQNYFLKKKIEFFSFKIYLYNLFLIKKYTIEFKKHYLLQLTIRRFCINQLGYSYFQFLVGKFDTYLQDYKYFQFLFDKYSYKYLLSLKVDKKNSFKFNDQILLLILFPNEYSYNLLLNKMLFQTNLTEKQKQMYKENENFLRKNLIGLGEKLNLFNLAFNVKNKQKIFIISKYLYYLVFYKVFNIWQFIFQKTFLKELKKKSVDNNLSDIVLYRNKVFFYIDSINFSIERLEYDLFAQELSFIELKYSI